MTLPRTVHEDCSSVDRALDRLEAEVQRRKEAEEGWRAAFEREVAARSRLAALLARSLDLNSRAAKLWAISSSTERRMAGFASSEFVIEHLALAEEHASLATGGRA